jgi:hypothetical protein
MALFKGRRKKVVFVLQTTTCQTEVKTGWKDRYRSPGLNEGERVASEKSRRKEMSLIPPW